MAQKSYSSNQISISTAKLAEVNAVAGSGKTSTLIKRLLYLAGIGVPAEQILVLSFSKTAVKELWCRMDAANNNLSLVTVSTAHAYANSLLAEQSILTTKREQVLLTKAIKLVKTSCLKSKRQGMLSKSRYERRLALLNVLGEHHNLKYILNFYAVVGASSKSVAEMAAKPLFSELIPYLKALGAVYKKYSALKQKSGVIDFGDMLNQAIAAIKAGAPVPYTHILVDEYQDCSPAQVELLVALADRGCSIMVFGDPGQAIYGFGGATYTPLRSVLNGVKDYSLPRSHRLSNENAALASAILGLKGDQAIKASRLGTRPVMVTSGSELDQAERIADDIEQLIAAGTSPEQIAVLGRIKALIHPVEQQLLSRNLSVARLQGGNDKKHALKVLRLVSLVGRAQKKKQKISISMLQQALPAINIVNKKWADVAAKMNKVQRTSSLEGRYRLCGKQYLRLLGGVRSDASRQHNVNRWEPLCRTYSSAKQMRDGLRAMPADALVMGSIHAGKGLEWEHVFIVGATDGYLPFYQARDKAQLSEERNLLYVAVTRARKSVRLFHAPCNHAKSRQRFEAPSAFIADVAVKKTLQVEWPSSC